MWWHLADDVASCTAGTFEQNMRRSRFHNLLKDSVFAAMCLRHKMSPVFYFNVKKKNNIWCLSWHLWLSYSEITFFGLEKNSRKIRSDTGKECFYFQTLHFFFYYFEIILRICFIKIRDKVKWIVFLQHNHRSFDLQHPMVSNVKQEPSS